LLQCVQTAAQVFMVLGGGRSATQRSGLEHILSSIVGRADPGTGCPGTSRAIPKKVAISWSRSRHPLGPKQARTGASTSYQLPLGPACRSWHAASPTGRGTSVNGLFYGADPPPGAPLGRMAVEGAERLLASTDLQIYWRMVLQIWRCVPPRWSPLIEEEK
jgi:hypothetical protein